MTSSSHVSVGITGLMGSGKSEAANYIKRTGYPVLLMDQVGHDTLKDKDILTHLVKVFGESILDNRAHIARKRLSEIVFTNQRKLTVLNDILHPKMNKKAKEWITWHFKRGHSLVFVEAAILFEMKMNQFLDITVLIKAAESDIRKRIIRRDHKSPQEIEKILKTQTVTEEKADYVIYNDSTLKDLYKSCDDLIEKLTQRL